MYLTDDRYWPPNKPEPIPPYSWRGDVGIFIFIVLAGLFDGALALAIVGGIWRAFRG